MTVAAPGRVAAGRVLLGVEEGDHAEELLGRLAPPAGPDRAQAWFLALGVLRRRGEIDAALRPLLKAPLGGLDAPVRAVLRLGTFERLAARTPAHAAVSQGVETARALGAGRASGLVNAILRRVAPAERLSRPEALGAPTWLVHRWDERYGPHAVEAWCRRNLEAPPTFAVARDRDAEAVGVFGELEVAPTRQPGVWRLPEGSGSVTELPGFREGRWWVQDPGAVAAADLVPPSAEILDACAAPGGKSLRLASRGARVLAVDRVSERLALVAEGSRRTGLSVETRRHDWRDGPLDQRFDAVLVDAPCTGLGTVRRHPEIKWRRSEPDLAEVSALQATILRHASRSVRPGGSLVYAVCSPEPEEGIAVIREFLAADPDFSLDEVLGERLPEEDADAHWAARLTRAR